MLYTSLQDWNEEIVIHAVIRNGLPGDAQTAGLTFSFVFHLIDLRWPWRIQATVTPPFFFHSIYSMNLTESETPRRSSAARISLIMQQLSLHLLPSGTPCRSPARSIEWSSNQTVLVFSAFLEMQGTTPWVIRVRLIYWYNGRGSSLEVFRVLISSSSGATR